MPVRRESSAARSSPKSRSSCGKNQDEKIRTTNERRADPEPYLRTRGLSGAYNRLLVHLPVRGGGPEDPRVHELDDGVELLQVVLDWSAFKNPRQLRLKTPEEPLCLTGSSASSAKHL